MSFLLDALGKADDDRRRSEVPELRTYQPKSPSMWVRVGRVLVLVVMLLGAFIGGYLARPWLEGVWLPEQKTDSVVTTAPAREPPAEANKTIQATVEPPEAAAEKSTLELEVISWSERPNARFAMINGSVVHEGDTLATGERLLRIERNAVILQQSDQTIRLTM